MLLIGKNLISKHASGPAPAIDLVFIPVLARMDPSVTWLCDFANFHGLGKEKDQSV